MRSLRCSRFRRRTSDRTSMQTGRLQKRLGRDRVGAFPRGGDALDEPVAEARFEGELPKLSDLEVGEPVRLLLGGTSRALGAEASGCLPGARPGAELWGGRLCVAQARVEGEPDREQVAQSVFGGLARERGLPDPVLDMSGPARDARQSAARTSGTSCSGMPRSATSCSIQASGSSGRDATKRRKPDRPLTSGLRSIWARSCQAA